MFLLDRRVCITVLPSGSIFINSLPADLASEMAAGNVKKDHS
jgi:hypothetical protein